MVGVSNGDHSLSSHVKHGEIFRNSHPIAPAPITKVFIYSIFLKLSFPTTIFKFGNSSFSFNLQSIISGVILGNSLHELIEMEGEELFDGGVFIGDCFDHFLGNQSTKVCANDWQLSLGD